MDHSYPTSFLDISWFFYYLWYFLELVSMECTISQTLKNCKEELGGELVPTYKHLVEENKEKR